MKHIKSFTTNKKQPLKYASIAGLFLVSFFLGRQSVVLKPTDNPSGEYSIYSPVVKDSVYLMNNYQIKENVTGKVYRCGKSMIYHPTKEHGSFKICKSKVYELTVGQARKLGMRHCKCSG